MARRRAETLGVASTHVEVVAKVAEMTDHTDGTDDEGPDLPEDELPGLHGPDDAPRPPWRGWTEAPTEEVYNLLWTSYRDGITGLRVLGKRTGAGQRTIQTAIDRGWPEKGWPSLRERMKLYERQRDASRQRELAAEKAKAEAEGINEAQAWQAFTKRSQALVSQAEDVLGEMGKKLKQAVQLATFIRYRRVRRQDEHGKVVLVDEAYVDGLALAKAVSLWTGSMKEMPSVMKVLLGPAALEAVPEMPAITDEQLAEMQQGRMPVGWTEQKVAMALMAAAKAAGGEP